MIVFTEDFEPNFFFLVFFSFLFATTGCQRLVPAETCEKETLLSFSAGSAVLFSFV